MLRRARSTRERLRGRLLGDERHIGLWILPLFVMVALLGATLVGGLAALYYAQQVGDLEEATSGARERLDEAVEDVDAAAAEAQSDIDEQVAQARDEFSRRSPVRQPAEAGVFAVSAEHPDGEVRVGSAFTVFSSEAETYFLTTYAVVATEAGGAIDLVNVFLPDQTLQMRVHSFDRERDLSILVARGGGLPVLDWRPPDDPLNPGDGIYVIGVAGSNTPVVLEGAVAGASELAVVPDVPLNSFLAGGPLIDGSGRVVAIASQAYAPFGQVSGSLIYAPPIRLVCDRLLRCTAADVGAEALGDEGGSGEPAGPPER